MHVNMLGGPIIIGMKNQHPMSVVSAAWAEENSDCIITQFAGGRSQIPSSSSTEFSNLILFIFDSASEGCIMDSYSV